MKNTKKFLLGVFAMSALMLGACSGGQKPAPSSSTAPAPTSSTEPAPEASSSQATSSEPEASTSVVPESSSEPEESTSAEEETSSEADPEESSSQEEEETEHTVTLNEAPTANRVVVVHGWKGTDDIVTAAAVVEGANVTFDLQTNDLDGYLIAELKEGKTFTDFVDADPEDGTKRNWNFVARQTNNVTDMSATEASWQSVAPTSEFDAKLDATATTAYAGRTFFVCSWKEGYVNAFDYFTAEGKVKIATAADGFLVAVLKEGKTAEDGVGEDWANVEDASKSADVKTLPEEKITIYATGAKLVVAVDDDEPETLADYYIRGTAVGGWDVNTVPCDANPGDNIAAFTNVALAVGTFKICTPDWKDNYGWWGYELNGSWAGNYTANAPQGTGVEGNFEAVDGSNDIKCLVAGNYNFYVNSSHQLYITVAE